MCTQTCSCARLEVLWRRHAYLLVAEHVPHAVAGEDDEEILQLQFDHGGIWLVGQNRPLWVHLELRISDRA